MDDDLNEFYNQIGIDVDSDAPEMGKCRDSRCPLLKDEPGRMIGKADTIGGIILEGKFARYSKRHCIKCHAWAGFDNE